jgi:hypothetical protein
MYPRRRTTSEGEQKKPQHHDPIQPSIGKQQKAKSDENCCSWMKSKMHSAKGLLTMQGKIEKEDTRPLIKVLRFG